MKKSVDSIPKGYKYEKNQAVPMPHGRITMSWENICTLPRSRGRKITFSSVPFESRVPSTEKKDSCTENNCDE